MEIKKALNRIAKFNNFENAKSYAGHCIKLHLIILGDNDKFWVAVPAVTEALIKDGYEYAL